MNLIDNIEIKNFKSIRHQKIEGCKRINVFIGYPNVGKSNILEALTTIQYCKLKLAQPLENYFRFKDCAELFFDANVKENAIISYNNFKSIYLNFVDSKSVEFSSVNYDLNAGYLFSISKNKKDNLIDVFKYQFIQKNNLQNALSNIHLESPFGDNFFLMLRDNVELRRSFNQLLEPSGLKLLIDKTSNAIGLIKSMDNDSIFQLSYVLLADTLQRLFFYKTAISTNKESVLLFEEPESHMFPPYISKFTNDIVFDENKNQYFIATHSPFVLNDLMDNLKPDELSIYIVSLKNESGETEIHRMSDSDMHEAYQFGYDFFMNIDKFIPQKQHG